MTIRILKIIFYSLILIALLSITIIFWLNSDSTKESIKNLIIKSFDEKTNYQIKIDDLSFSLPLIMQAKKVSLADGIEEFAKIDELYINVIPSIFFLWKINIWEVSASKIKLLRKPAMFEAKQKSTTSKNKNIPTIVINKLNFREIILGQKLLNTKTDLTIDLKSSAKINFVKSIIDLNLTSKALNQADNYLTNAELKVQANFDLSTKKVTVEAINFLSDAMDIKSSAIIDLDSTKIDGKITYSSSILKDMLISRFPDTTSEITGAIEISGYLSQIVLKATGEIKATIPGQDYFNFPELTWSSEAQIYPNNDKKIDGNLIYQFGKFTGSGAYTWQGDQFSLDKLSFIGDSAKNYANFAYNFNQNKLSGDLHLLSSNLNEFAEILPFIEKGKIDLKTKYEFTEGKSKLKIMGNLSKFQSQLINIDRTEIDFQSNDLAELNISNSKLSFNQFNWQGINISKAIINASSDGSKFNIASQIIASDPYRASLNINNQIVLDSNGIKLTINKIEGDLNKVKVKLNKAINIIFNRPRSKLADVRQVQEVHGAQEPAMYENVHEDLSTGTTTQLSTGVEFQKRSDDQIDIAKSTILLDEGNLNFEGNINKDSIDLVSSFGNIPTQLFDGLFTEEFRNAKVSGKINLSGNHLSPQFIATLDIHKVHVAKNSENGTFNIRSKNDQSSLITECNILDQSKKLVEISSNLPIKFSTKPFILEFKKEAPIEIKLKTNDKVNLLSFVNLPTGHKLGGELKGTVSIKGTINSPEIFANLDLTNGKYSYKRIGLKTKNISSKIKAAGNKITFHDLQIGDYFDNYLYGSGGYTINDLSSFDFKLESKKFNLLNSPYVQGQVHGNIHLIGNSEKAIAKGDMTFGPMYIKIPERIQESIPTVNVVEIIEENDNIYFTKKSEPYKLILDISAATSNQVFVSGWGVKTRLEGNLHIVGSIDSPEITGKLVSVHGKYQDFGRQLDISTGELIFDGPIPPSPYLNIIGVTQEGSNELRLTLSGSLLSPNINISSTPAMNQEEALSMLLFGENPDNISAFQAFQLANSMRRLSGGGSTIDPLDTGRKALGIDDISIKNDKKKPENTAIGVGKHLTDKLYLEVEQGIEAGTTKTKIEVEISPKVTIEGSTENTGNSSVGVNWRFDY